MEKDILSQTLNQILILICFVLLIIFAHLFVVKKTLVDQFGGFTSKYDGAQDYDFIFRSIELSNKIYHIPKFFIIGEHIWILQQKIQKANYMHLKLE